VNRILFVISAALALVAFPFNAGAWGGAGHMVIAAEAFGHLSPELKAEAIDVLKSHPDFSKWANAYHPGPNVDLATFIFMRSSTWPDEIRRKGNEYDHPDWHFIDYPLRPPGFAFEPDARPTDNVLYGIAECEKTLSDAKASPEIRAVYLSYLIHLVGDIHQPLHCESYFGDGYPKGDKGGNDFFVKPARTGVRLHGIWDGLLGTSANAQSAWKYAVTIDAQFPRVGLPELQTNTTPKSWSLESRQLAIQYGYLNGNLQGSTEAGTAPPLPDGYTKAAKAVAERQAALAGYRLADEIQKYLAAGKPAALTADMTNLVAESPATANRKIAATEASQHYNESLTVTGKVAQVSSRGTVAFLNLDKRFPDSPFTAVIFQNNLDAFGDLQKYAGKNVEITGTVTEYRGKPEIVLDSPDQINVVP
jgi:hypothetical protein